MVTPFHFRHVEKLALTYVYTCGKNWGLNLTGGISNVYIGRIYIKKKKWEKPKINKRRETSLMRMSGIMQMLPEKKIRDKSCYCTQFCRMFSSQVTN